MQARRLSVIVLMLIGAAAGHGQERGLHHGEDKTFTSCVALAPDGTTVAIGCPDGIIRLRDCSGGQQRSRWQAHRRAIQAIAYDPSGCFLVSASQEEPAIMLWDAHNGTEVGRFTHLCTLALTFSGDSTLLATSGMDHVVRLWEVSSGHLRATLIGHQAPVMSVAFSPNGLMLASGSQDGEVKIWQAGTRPTSRSYPGPRSPVCGLAFSGNGQTLIAVSQDGTVRLRNVINGKEEGVLRTGDGVVNTVAFSPNSRQLVLGVIDGAIRFWDLPLEKERAVLHGPRQPLVGLVFGPEGRILAAGNSDGTVKISDVRWLFKTTSQPSSK
jgi:WD40 repeat protein